MLFKKRALKRKRKKQEGTYWFGDIVADILLWIPELILLPFRMVFLLIRLLVRSIFDAF